MPADICLNLFPLVFTADFFAAGANWQKPFEDADPVKQPPKKYYLQGNDQAENHYFNGDFTTALIPCGCLVPHQKVRQVEYLIRRCKGQKENQNQNLNNYELF